MARRRSYVSAFAQVQREAARAQAAQVRAQAAARREAERARTAYMRATAADEKERKRLYAESRAAEVAARNDDLDAEITALQDLLAVTLKVNDRISFSSLKKPAAVPPWEGGQLERPETPPAPDAFRPAPPTGLSKVFAKNRYEQALEEGRVRYEGAVQEYAARERQRIMALEKSRAEWRAAAEAANAEARRQHAEIDAFEADYRRGVQDAVAAYCSMVLEASQYPKSFPQQFKLAYVPGSRQAVVEYELPTVAVVSAVKAYRYVKTSDTIAETSRPQAQVKTLYASVVAQVAIRTVHELLKADAGGHVDTVVFNGVVDTTDPGSGRRIRPCLVSVRTTRDAFGELDLARVEPLACLKHLSAGVSKSPSELVPVRPVLEFNMVDPRFVAESDALSELDQRPNLMDLSPTEFEALIQNLFTKMGLEARWMIPGDRLHEEARVSMIELWKTTWKPSRLHCTSRSTTS